MLPFSPRNTAACGPLPLAQSRLTKRKVSKCLFGKIDPAETRAWFADQFKQIEEDSRQKWNYDFKIDAPLCDPSSSDWSWSPLDQSQVPNFYHQKVIAPVTNPENRQPAHVKPDSIPVNCQFRPIRLPSTPAGKRLANPVPSASSASPVLPVRRKLKYGAKIEKPKPIRGKLTDVFRVCKRVSTDAVKEGGKIGSEEEASPSKFMRVNSKP